MIVSAEELMPKTDLATLSHELRAPLNAIIGFSEALKDGLVGRLSEPQHEYVCDIFKSGLHLLSLINGIDVNQATPTMPDSAGAAAMAMAAPGKRIALVVDDDDRAAGLLRLLLEAEGFAVIRAVSAEDALLLVPQQALGLITLDLEMYGINGWQFLAENSRKRPPGPGTGGDRLRPVRPYRRAQPWRCRRAAKTDQPRAAESHSGRSEPA